MANLVRKYGWHEWLAKTNFSFLIGASHPFEIIERANQLEYGSVAVLDYDGVYGLARAHHERNKLLEEDPCKPVPALKLGAECHIFLDHDEAICSQDTLCFIVENKTGYENLCRLLTYAHRDGKDYATLPLDYILNADVTGLIALKPMRGSQFTRTSRNHSQIVSKLSDLQAHFAGDLYFAISRHATPSEKTLIESTLTLAQQTNARVLASQDAFFSHPNQKALSDLLHAIRCNQIVDKIPEHLFLNSRRSLWPLDYLNNLYKDLPNFEAMLRDSRFLCERCQFSLKELKYSYPKEMIPKGFSPDKYLDKITWEHAKKEYPHGIPIKIVKQLNYELNLVSEMKFSDYFLTVFDVVCWARQQNILCQGRGSAANSAICYVLGITSVNPANYDLLFERFINKERKDPPDIDVDFEHERREEVLQYVYERYGRSRAAMVANVICFKSKGSLRSSGEALGVPSKFIDHASRVMSTKEFRSKGLQETILAVREDIADDETPMTDLQCKLWSNMAVKLMGFPRHMGIHSGGFVISSESLNRLSPVEPATMSGRTVLQWSKVDIEGLGFFKIDLLSLGGLTLIRKTFDFLREHYALNLDLNQIPQDDPETYSMIQKADTVGTFQIESRAQMAFLPRHKPRNFYDLVIEVAIIRPGPIQGGVIHPYLRRRDGLDPVTYPDPRLEHVLKRTYGIPIFQEQVMRIAIEVGDFTAGEANELRKNIGSFQLQERSNEWIDKLIRGMRKNGVKDNYIEIVLNQIRTFASYGFPESHAASFASLAYVTSYLKCHYPTAFFAAILNSQPMGFYNVDTLIRTAHKIGVQFAPVDAVKSSWDHTIEVDEAGVRRVRLGFRIVTGLSEVGIRRFMAHRTNSSWDTLLELVSGSRLSRVDFTALAAADAFYGFGIDRRSALWIAEAAPFCDILDSTDDSPLFGNLDELQEVELDYKATSTSLRTHPTKLMRESAWLYSIPKQKVVLSRTLRKKINQKHIPIFGMVTSRQAPPTAKGVMFFTLWDEFGSVDIVIKPKVYQNYRRIIDSQSFLCVEGTVQGDENFQSLMVTNVLAPQPKRADVLPMEAGEYLYDRRRALASTRSYMC